MQKHKHNHDHDHQHDCDIDFKPTINITIENNIFLEAPCKEASTRLVLSGIKYYHFIIKNSIIMAITLNVQEFVTSTLGLIDHVTQAPITSAVFSNQSFVSDSPAIATVDAAGKVTAISAGTANVSFISDVTYTNSGGTSVTETGKLLVVAATVNGTPQTTDLTVTFSAPQHV